MVDLFNAGLLGHGPNTLMLFGELAISVTQNKLGLKQKPRKLPCQEFVVQDDVDVGQLADVVKRHEALKVRLRMSGRTSNFPSDLDVQVLDELDKYFADAVPAICMAGWNAIP